MAFSIYISLGSNIHPEENLTRAIGEIRQNFGLVVCSSVIETSAEGSTGPNFLNAAANFQTSFSTDELKYGFLRNLESSLGRIRTADKNAPRTIDLDISIVDQTPRDMNIWNRIYLAVPLAELIPEIIDPESGKTLASLATEMQKRAFWKARPDVNLNLTF